LGGFFQQVPDSLFHKEIFFFTKSAEDLLARIHQDELFAEAIFDLDGRLIVF
jgi:hypothetical protein